MPVEEHAEVTPVPGPENPDRVRVKVRYRIPSQARRRRRRRRRRIVGLVGVGLFLVLLAVGALGLRDAFTARDRLVSARAVLDQAIGQPAALRTAGGRAATIQDLDQAIGNVAAARQVVAGSLAFKVARFLPVASTQRSGLLRLVSDSTTALRAGRALLVQVDALTTKGTVVGAKVPLGSLATFETDVRTAGSAIAPLNRSPGGLIGPLGKARRDFNALAVTTGARLRNDADALAAAQGFLGADGARHYLIAVENDSEERDQGSVLSFALATFDHGQAVIGTHGSTQIPVPLPTGPPMYLVLKGPTAVTIPAGTATVFGSILPTQIWQSVNATADFSYSGAVMQAMFRQATGQTVDGVIGLDVPALASLLSVVGPVTVPGIAQPVTSANASVVLMHDFYSAFETSEEAARHEVLGQVVDQIVARLTAGTFDPVALAEGLAASAAGRHIQLWSAEPAEESLLGRTGLSGSPAASAADRTFHVAVENRNSTKMDYYIEPSVQQAVTVTKAGTAIVKTTVTVHNAAPVNSAPSFQLGPDGFGTTRPGEYWAWVLLWGPSHSSQPGSVTESGLQLSQTILDRIYAGQSKQVTFVTVIPNAVRSDGTLSLRYVPQPRLEPPMLAVTVQADGWTIHGSPSWSGPWTASMTLKWKLQR